MKPYILLQVLATTILAPPSCKAQFNEEQVAMRYAALQDSLDRADSLLASGDRTSALAIYKATTPWKHNAGWRFMRRMKCTIGLGEAGETRLDSMIKFRAIPSMQRPALEQLVDSLGELDQEVRNLPWNDENARLMGKTDSTNIDLLYAAFQENGGYIQSEGGTLILIHALALKPDHLDYFAKTIADALLNQEIDSYTYGVIVDEYMWQTRNCQVFGCIGRPDDPDVQALRWCDPERTNRLRKLLGLPAATE